jgi:hypothetical protein
LTDASFLNFSSGYTLQVRHRDQRTRPHRALRFYPAAFQLYFFNHLLGNTICIISKYEKTKNDSCATNHGNIRICNVAGSLISFMTCFIAGPDFLCWNSVLEKYDYIISATSFATSLNAASDEWLVTLFNFILNIF